MQGAVGNPMQATLNGVAEAGQHSSRPLGREGPSKKFENVKSNRPYFSKTARIADRLRIRGGRCFVPLKIQKSCL